MKKHNDSHILNGISVEVHHNFEKSLRIFSKKVQESGIIKEVKDRQFHETNTEIKQRKQKAARNRWLKKVDGMEPKKDTKKR